MKPNTITCPRCGEKLKGRPEWIPSKGLTGNTTYSHIHSLGEILEGTACLYVHTEKAGNEA